MVEAGGVLQTCRVISVATFCRSHQSSCSMPLLCFLLLGEFMKVLSRHQLWQARAGTWQCRVGPWFQITGYSSGKLTLATRLSLIGNMVWAWILVEAGKNGRMEAHSEFVFFLK